MLLTFLKYSIYLYHIAINAFSTCCFLSYGTNFVLFILFLFSSFSFFSFLSSFSKHLVEQLKQAVPNNNEIENHHDGVRDDSLGTSSSACIEGDGHDFSFIEVNNACICLGITSLYTLGDGVDRPMMYEAALNSVFQQLVVAMTGSLQRRAQRRAERQVAEDYDEDDEEMDELCNESEVELLYFLHECIGAVIRTHGKYLSEESVHRVMEAL